MTPALKRHRSPLIAGASGSGGDFDDLINFVDADLGDGNLFDLTKSPDTLQTFDSLSASDSKTVLASQDLTSAQLPDSPNDSYQDSSSDSASCQRAGSSTPIKPRGAAGDATMDAAEKLEWDTAFAASHGADDYPFMLGGDSRGELTFEELYRHHDFTAMGNDFGYNPQDSSPEPANGGPMSMPSPEMPTIEPLGLLACDDTPKRTTSHSHRQAPSVHSVHSPSPSLTANQESREVTPMSNMVMSTDGSPAPMPDQPSKRNSQNRKAQRNHNGNGPRSRKSVSMFDSLTGNSHVGSQMDTAFGMPNFLSSTLGLPIKYTLKIDPTPFKSRVETQIPIRLTLNPIPPGITRLHLPAHTVSKPKLMIKPNAVRSPDMLELHVVLVCVSAMETPGAKQDAFDRARALPQRYLPGEDDENNPPQNGGFVRICQGCITRERKRAARKKNRKPEEDELWLQDEHYRVVVFNTQEIKQWQPVPTEEGSQPDTLQVDVPMRIACYCRHHGEKNGFYVIFTLKDHQDQVVVQTMSSPIMITDDHKTHHFPPAPAQPVVSENQAPSLPPVTSAPPADASCSMPSLASQSFHMSPSSGDLSALQRNGQVPFQNGSCSKAQGMAAQRALSRSASPPLQEPIAKRRKASNSRVPDGLAMTRIDTSPSPTAQPGVQSGVQAPNTQIPSATSPFTTLTHTDAMFGQSGCPPFATGSPTSNNNNNNNNNNADPHLFHNSRSVSLENLNMAQMYSAPVSNHPSRAPSPTGLRNSIAVPAQNQLAQALANNLFNLPLTLNPQQKPPSIYKVIPREGSKMGGIEVTVLGESFFQGLEIWFGEQKATTTTYWGESSLVCLLPPSHVTGEVLVHSKHLASQGSRAFTLPRQPVYFKYIDDTEDKIVRHAFAVLAQKMSGQMLDVGEMARRILTEPGVNNGGSGSSNNNQTNGQMFSHAPYAHLESQLLKCLDLIDLDDSQHRTQLDLKRSSGHTLLHMACILGYHRFVAALLARGASPNTQDNGGYTPLHMAAIYNHHEIVRRLMLIGADATIKSKSGLTAADVAPSRAVLRAVRRSERHIRRSRSSGGSLHSRASSATSLRSLWEPMTKVHTHEEPLPVDSSEESPEYTSGDFEDEDPDENAYLSMRRPSGFGRDRERPDLRPQESKQLEESLEASTLKEHFQNQLQQFQQAMAVQFQNLPQMQMPTFPGMPTLHDYQAYLPQAPFMRRVTQLMPGMGGARAEPEESSSPPPYEEIFPRVDIDIDQKDASEARASIEAEADLRCTALYDQAKASTSVSAAASTVASASTSTSKATKPEPPSVLTIGRKNAITKEQQEQFLRAREVKMKRLSSDRNLFFIWIPLLIVTLCAMLYSFYPSLFPFAWAFVRSLYTNGLEKTQQLIQQDILPDRVVEV